MPDRRGRPQPLPRFAALIAAGLAGIDEGLELEPAFVGDAYHAEEVREIPRR
jgi:glutamine synthetase